MTRITKIAGALLATTALAASATGALAGALDRSNRDIGILFEEGNYGELSFGRAVPDVSGVQSAPVGFVPPGGESGDMAESFNIPSVGLKMQFSERLSAAIIYDEPFGADTAYPTGQPYFASGAIATLDSKAVTGLLRYHATDRISVYGGLRYQKLSAEAVVPYVAGYTVEGEQDEGYGYVLGAAYEIPDIALRVSLTYDSAIEHELDTTEGGLLPGTSTTEIETPQSATLAFQTGVAEGTLVFGSIRWAEWSEFDITPDNFALLTGGASLVQYTDDIWTYTLGVGRQLTDNFAGAVSVTYEPQAQEFSSNLGPTDGRVGISIGGTLDMGHGLETTAGISYSKFLNTETALLGSGVSEFEDNDAIGFGVSIGYSF